jgi:hypothetical protein
MRRLLHPRHLPPELQLLRLLGPLPRLEALQVALAPCQIHAEHFSDQIHDWFSDQQHEVGHKDTASSSSGGRGEIYLTEVKHTIGELKQHDTKCVSLYFEAMAVTLAALDYSNCGGEKPRRLNLDSDLSRNMDTIEGCITHGLKRITDEVAPKYQTFLKNALREFDKAQAQPVALPAGGGAQAGAGAGAQGADGADEGAAALENADAVYLQKYFFVAHLKAFLRFKGDSQYDNTGVKKPLIARILRDYSSLEFSDFVTTFNLKDHEAAKLKLNELRAPTGLGELVDEENPEEAVPGEEKS